jgi:hypothetical protein
MKSQWLPLKKEYKKTYTYKWRQLNKAINYVVIIIVHKITKHAQL